MSPEERAIEFFTAARIEMQYQPDKYAALVDIMTKHGRSVAEVTAEVLQLLQGQRGLILTFNRLLTPELRIPAQIPIDVERAFEFVSRIEERSRHHEGLYGWFLSRFDEHSLQPRPRIEVTIQIVDVLKGHQDLLHDFFSFLRPQLRHLTLPLSSEAIAKFLRFAKTELREQPHDHAALVEILTKHRRSALEVRTEVEQLLRDRTLLILKFNDLLPPEIRIPLPEVFVPFAFQRRVEERFGYQRHYYVWFNNLVGMYRSGAKPFLQITRQMMALFRNEPDLRRDFLGFLTPDVRRLAYTWLP